MSAGRWTYGWASRWTIGALLALTMLRCSPSPAQAPVAPPRRFETGSDLVPNDIDIVIRIAWSRVRASSFHNLALQSLREHGAGAVLAPALERARAIFVGLRVMPDGVHGDGVLVIESDCVELAEAELHTLIGGGPIEARDDHRSAGRILVRAGPTSRLDRALVWAIDGKAIVLATVAEVDAVERLAREGPEARHVDVPARGLLSFAARPPAGRRWSTPWPAFVRALGVELVGASGAVDLVDDGMRIEVELEYSSERAAGTAAKHLRTTLERIARAEGPVGDALRASPKMQIAAERGIVSADWVLPLRAIANLLR